MSEYNVLNVFILKESFTRNSNHNDQCDPDIRNSRTIMWKDRCRNEEPLRQHVKA